MRQVVIPGHAVPRLGRSSPRWGVALAVGVLVLPVFSGLGGNRSLRRSRRAVPFCSLPLGRAAPRRAVPSHLGTAAAASRPGRPAPAEPAGRSTPTAREDHRDRVRFDRCVQRAEHRARHAALLRIRRTESEGRPDPDHQVALPAQPDERAAQRAQQPHRAERDPARCGTATSTPGFNDSTVWHANNGSWWSGPVNHSGQDKSYGWW